MGCNNSETKAKTAIQTSAVYHNMGIRTNCVKNLGLNRVDLENC